MIEAPTICFAERESLLKDPGVFAALGFQHITGFAQVSCYYHIGTTAVSMAAKAKPKPEGRFAAMERAGCLARRMALRPERFVASAAIDGEPWDRWLNKDNEFRDLDWLQKQAPGRRGLHLGGWFAHDTYPEWHGREVSKLIAAEITRRFPGETQPIDLLYIDHEGTRTSDHLIESLSFLAPLCKKVANFNRFTGPGWWGENPPTHRAVGVGCPEWYGGAKNITRFKRAIRLNPGCVPVLPVCSADTDWSRIAPWDKITDATRNLLTYWHGQDESNRVCMIAPYMLNKATGGPPDNYFASPIRLGVGRSIEYMGELDLMIGELEGG